MYLPKMCFLTNSGALNFLRLIGHSHLSFDSSTQFAVMNASVSLQVIRLSLCDVPSGNFPDHQDD